MTSNYYEGWVRARVMLDDHTRAEHVVDEIVISRRRGVRYRVGRTLVALGTQLMGDRQEHRRAA